MLVASISRILVVLSQIRDSPENLAANESFTPKADSLEPDLHRSAATESAIALVS